MIMLVWIHDSTSEYTNIAPKCIFNLIWTKYNKIFNYPTNINQQTLLTRPVNKLVSVKAI